MTTTRETAARRRSRISTYALGLMCLFGLAAPSAGKKERGRRRREAVDRLCPYFHSTHTRTHYLPRWKAWRLRRICHEASSRDKKTPTSSSSSSIIKPRSSKTDTTHHTIDATTSKTHHQYQQQEPTRSMDPRRGKCFVGGARPVEPDPTPHRLRRRRPRRPCSRSCWPQEVDEREEREATGEQGSDGHQEG
jgi:hypothetical protein